MMIVVFFTIKDILMLIVLAQETITIHCQEQSALKYPKLRKIAIIFFLIITKLI